MPVQFDAKLDAKLRKSIARDRKKRRRRPTAAGVLIHEESGDVLIVYGTAVEQDAGLNPGIVKGGIDRSEGVVDALIREIYEELGIPHYQIDILGYLGRHDVKSLKQKGGYARKRYYVVVVLYRGDKDIVVNPLEVAGHEWLPIEEVREVVNVLRGCRPEKHKALTQIFGVLRRKLGKKLRKKP
jgi:8-oxo-dGTP pyrophosphatase MutT (NUDIX family)